MPIAVRIVYSNGELHNIMGNSQSHPIFLALQELSESRKLKMKRSTIERFLSECNALAPWFTVSGNHSVACWDKLGEDLDFAWSQGTLKPGVRPVWHLVHSCLEDQRCCQEVLEKGLVTLEMLQEERSEKQGGTKETDTERSDTDREMEGMDTEDELQELIEQVSPWFIANGGLNIPDWKQVKRDSQKALQDKGSESIPIATFSLWRLVKDVLLSENLRVKEQMMEIERTFGIAQDEHTKESICRDSSDSDSIPMSLMQMRR